MGYPELWGPASKSQHEVCNDGWSPLLLFSAVVSEWVKQNVSCPFLIIRRAAVANARMKISSSQSPLASPQSAGPGESIPPESFLRYSTVGGRFRREAFALWPMLACTSETCPSFSLTSPFFLRCPAAACRPPALALPA